MQAPTVKTLVSTFRDLTPTTARLIRRLVATVDDTKGLASLIKRHCPETHAYRLRRYHDPLCGSRAWVEEYGERLANEAFKHNVLGSEL